MAAKPKHSRSLRMLSRERIENDALWELADRYRRGPRPPLAEDRSYVLIAVAFVEQALEDAILTRCTAKYSGTQREILFGGDRPGALNGFFSKIVLGSALGLYSQLFQEDLDKLRHIRNAFAHAKGVIDFETAEISAACSFHITDYFSVTDQMLEALAQPHERFTLAVFVAISTFGFIVKDDMPHRPEAYDDDVVLP